MKMNRFAMTLLTGLAAALFPGVALGSPVPQTLSYQGRVTSNNGHFNGDGFFKFALVNADGSDTYWANDVTLVDGAPPVGAVALPVSQGLFQVVLGDGGLDNMAPIPASVFQNPDVHLRIWFSDGNGEFELMTPDQPIHSVGYAMMSGNIPEGAIDASHLGEGVVGQSHLAENSVTSAHIVDGTVASRDLNPSLSLRELELETASGLNRIELDGSGESGVIRMNHGAIGRFFELVGTLAGGQLKLFDKLGGTLTGQTTVELGSQATGGYGRFFQDNGMAGVDVYGQQGDAAGGQLEVANAAGQKTFEVIGGTGTQAGSEVKMFNGAGVKTIELDGQWNPGHGGTIRLFKADGTASIRLQADQNGAGRIVADVIQINGADLSEGFDITTPGMSPEPGMVVCIDPEDPGKLVLSSKAYDRTAAGVVSGAGGVRPGLLMGQEGTLANGKHPVALTGRVYCNVDAGVAPIKPGDMITTSDIPGHGMKAVDYDRARGAIIGKAMTGLASGRGQVLVLISLQ